MFIEQYSAQLTESFKLVAWQAHQTAMLGRVKKIPQLKEYLKGFEPKKIQTPDEMAAMVIELNKQFSGKDNRGK